MSSLGAQWFKDLALSLLWLRSLLWHRVDPWPGNFYMPQVWPKKKKKRERDTLETNARGVQDGAGEGAGTLLGAQTVVLAISWKPCSTAGTGINPFHAQVRTRGRKKIILLWVS